MKVLVGARSDVGRVRQANEDSYLINDPLFVVADGMGGHVAGDVASSTAVETIKEGSGGADGSDVKSLERLVQLANNRIWQRAQSDPELRGMGTTCTLLLIEGRLAYIAHVGDSRAYLLRQGHLSQLTEDHSLVGRMVREGRLSTEEAERHPQRSIVTRALGVDSEVAVDVLSVELEPRDRILLCSDGLTSMAETGAITDILKTAGDPQDAADRLVDLANEGGGEDNITVVVIDVDSNRTKRRQIASSARENGEQSGSRTTSPMSAVSPTAAATAVRDRDEPLAEHIEVEAPPRRGGRKLLIAGLILAVVVVAGLVGARYLLSNSWFVGVNDDGRVTIFSGIPDEIAGISLASEEEVAELRVNDLPDFLQGSVTEGIKVNSITDARRRIRSLERHVEESEPPRKGDRNDQADSPTKDRQKG
jgi:serine/threonine protein phosphatase PrpC